MTVLVVTHGTMKSISILTEDLRPKINVDVDKPRNFFRKEVQWTLGIG
jgi:hypothetical protein